MYILESHNQYGRVNCINIYKTLADAQDLLKAWEEIANGKYPVTLKRVTKMEALNYYTKNLIQGLRERREKDSKTEEAKSEINHVLCLLFKIEDSTREPSK